MAVRHLSEIRDVDITITGAPMAIDAYKAVNKKVEELEAEFENDPGKADLTAAVTVLTGATPYKVYSFNLTTVFASAEYTFAFVAEAPNVESLP